MEDWKVTGIDDPRLNTDRQRKTVVKLYDHDYYDDINSVTTMNSYLQETFPTKQQFRFSLIMICFDEMTK